MCQMFLIGRMGTTIPQSHNVTWVNEQQFNKPSSWDPNEFTHKCHQCTFQCSYSVFLMHYTDH